MGNGFVGSSCERGIKELLMCEHAEADGDEFAYDRAALAILGLPALSSLRAKA